MPQKTNHDEIKLRSSLERMTGISLDSSDAARALPYIGYRRKKRADAIWRAPEGCSFKGICLEFQGMGAHSRITGMADDCAKCATAQLNGYMWLPITYHAPSVAAQAKRLRKMADLILGGHDKTDDPRFDPMEDI